MRKNIGFIDLIVILIIIAIAVKIWTYKKPKIKIPSSSAKAVSTNKFETYMYLTRTYFYNRVKLGSEYARLETVNWLNKKGPEDPEYPFIKDVTRAYINDSGDIVIAYPSGEGTVLSLPQYITKEYKKCLIEDMIRAEEKAKQ